MPHIYIYILWSYYLGQVWPFQGLLSGPSQLVLNTGCRKLEKKGARKNFRGYYPGQVGHLFVATNLVQIIPPYLAQMITLKMIIVLPSFALNSVLKYLFYSVFEHQHKFVQTMGQKKRDLFTFRKNTGYKNKRFVATPSFTKNWCFISSLFER